MEERFPDYKSPYSGLRMMLDSNSTADGRML